MSIVVPIVGEVGLVAATELFATDQPLLAIAADQERGPDDLGVGRRQRLIDEARLTPAFARPAPAPSARPDRAGV